MSRILLTWELGLNSGHLARLVPISLKLRAQGHAVLVAARDIQVAAKVLGPLGLPFVQAPHLAKGLPLPHRAAGYADILLSQGWGDKSALWALTQSWLNLIDMYKPERLILDYSPTASLAARIAALPCILIGNGFELPPLTDPLPPFPGFPWATIAKAAEAERCAVSVANAVLAAFGGPAFVALRDLFSGQQRLFATVPQLDHYGEREDAVYVGPLYAPELANSVSWPSGDGPKIFASLRPDTANVNNILAALGGIDGSVVCVAGGFNLEQLSRFSSGQIRFSLVPLNLKPLLDADLCISYGAEGTVLRFLTAGIPQLVSPWHVETFMALRGLQEQGVAESLEPSKDVPSIIATIGRLARDASMKGRVRALAERIRPTIAAGAITLQAELAATSAPARGNSGQGASVGGRESGPPRHLCDA